MKLNFLKLILNYQNEFFQYKTNKYNFNFSFCNAKLLFHLNSACHVNKLSRNILYVRTNYNKENKNKKSCVLFYLKIFLVTLV